MTTRRTTLWRRLTSSVFAASLAVLAAPTAGAAQEAKRPLERATVSLPAPAQSLDPAATVSATDRAAFSLTNGTLFNIEIDGKIVPGLAESIAYSDDFASATVTLRPNLKFSDGSPLTAADAAATFNRHKGVKGSVLGSMTNRITTAEATGDRTVKFSFTGPFPSFGDFSAAGSFGIYPAAGLEKGESFFRSPVTSGPYKIASPWASNKLALVANEHYWGPKPIAKAITLTVIEDANSAVSQLQSGGVDYAGDLPPNFLTQLRNNAALSVGSVQTYGFYDLRMWNQSGPFADPNMRKAVSAALDRNAIARAIWGVDNKPQAGFWPPASPWHDPNRDAKQDLAAARAHLAKTACANGCEVRMMYSDQEFPFASQLALIVQNQLNRIGIKVRLERLDAPTLIQRLRAGDYDLVPGAMAASAGVPDQLLANALLGTGPLKAEFTGYNSPEMDKLIAGLQSSSGETRNEFAKKIETQFLADQPYAVLAPWVRGAASRLPKEVVSLVGTGLAVGSEKP